MDIIFKPIKKLKNDEIVDEFVQLNRHRLVYTKRCEKLKKKLNIIARSGYDFTDTGMYARKSKAIDFEKTKEAWKEKFGDLPTKIIPEQIIPERIIPEEIIPAHEIDDDAVIEAEAEKKGVLITKDSYTIGTD